MKQALHTPTRRRLMPLILLCAILSVKATCAQEQQRNINVDVNDFSSNTNVKGNHLQSNRNVNTFIATGPNGSGPININVQVIDNGTGLPMGGPNVRGFIAPVIPKQTVSSQASNKPKTVRPVSVKTASPKPLVATASTVKRPKPKPKPATAAPRRVARPAAQAIAAPMTTAPVIAMQEQVQAPVSNPVVPVNDPPQAIQQVMSNAVIVQTNYVPAGSAPVAGMAKASSVRSSASSAGSGSSDKSRRSVRKKHGSFYYSANKKMMKLFAKNKKGKFDPAKCFVWK